MRIAANPGQRLSLALLVVFFTFITWLGSHGIANESLWYDEIWSMRYAGGMQYGPISLSETVNRVLEQLAHERNPPAYYLLLNRWGNSTGWTEYSARVLSLLAGLLSIAWTYRLAYDIAQGEAEPLRRAMAIGAAVTLGASAFFIEYAQEIRAYIFIILFTAMTLALYWRIMHTPRRLTLALQAGFVLGWVGLLYIHYSTLLFLVVLGLYHVIVARKGPRWRRVVTLALIGTVTFLPWMQVFLAASRTAVDTFRTVAMPAPTLLKDLAVSFSSDNVALLAVLLIFATFARGRYAGFVWFMTLGGLGLAIIGNSLVPIIALGRYLIFLWPLFALLMGFALSYFRGRLVSAAPILAIWIIFAVISSFNLQASNVEHAYRYPWKTMVSVLDQHIQPADVVVFHSPVTVWFQGPELEHYMHSFSNRYSLMEGIPGYLKDDEYFKNVQKFLNNAPRIWIGIDQTVEPNFRLAEFKRAIADDYVFCYTAFDVREMRFDLYSHTISSPDMTFGNGIGLKLEEPIARPSNQALTLMLGIQQADSIPRDTYSLGLHVQDASGKLVAQSDFGLPADAQACRKVDIDVTNLPVGSYHLTAVVYNWQTGQRLPGSQRNTASADEILLGTVTIDHNGKS